MGIQRYHFARDVEEALSLLAAYEGRGALVAGGVDVMLSLPPETEGLIDVTTAGLSYVEERKGELRVGATTTLARLQGAPGTERYLGGFLREVLRLVANPALRNMATLGGALVAAHSWADIPTVLVALGAVAVWQGDGKEERATVGELYGRPFRGIFRRAVLTEIRFPRWDGAFAFEKISRNAGDIALLNAACGLGLDDEGRIAWARVALGATPRRGQRLPGIEEMLLGEVPSDALWETVQREVEAQAQVGDDMRASAEWRRAVAGVLVRRALSRAAGKLQERGTG